MEGKCTKVEQDRLFKFTQKIFCLFCFFCFFLLFFCLVEDEFRFILQEDELRWRSRYRLVEDLLERPLKDLLAVSLNLRTKALPRDARATALSILVVSSFGLVHLDSLPLLARIGEGNAPQDKLVLQPETGVQEVDDVPVLFGTKGRRTVRGEALTLLGLLLVAHEVSRNLLTLLDDGLGPLRGCVLVDTRMVVKDELHDVLADVLGHIGKANRETCAGENGLRLLHIGLVESKARPQNICGVGVHRRRFAGTVFLGVTLQVADCARHFQR